MNNNKAARDYDCVTGSHRSLIRNQHVASAQSPYDTNQDELSQIANAVTKRAYEDYIRKSALSNQHFVFAQQTPNSILDLLGNEHHVHGNEHRVNGRILAYRAKQRGEPIILLLARTCHWYTNLSRDFPCNERYDEASLMCDLTLEVKHVIPQLLRNLAVTEEENPYLFYTPNGRVSRDNWIDGTFTKVTTIADLKAKLYPRLTRWKQDHDEKQPGNTNSAKRPRVDDTDAKDFPLSTDFTVTSAEPPLRYIHTSSFRTRLKAIRACQTIDEFIDMYDCGIVYDCLLRLGSAFSHYDHTLTQKEKAKLWAVGLRDSHDPRELTMDQDRKCCLELLYTMCNRWDEKIITREDIIKGFKSKRIMGILLPYCLPMDQAKSLHFRYNNNTDQRGIPWYAEQHKEFVVSLSSYFFLPSINKRYFKLLGLDALIAQHISKWLQPQMPESMTTQKMKSEKNVIL